MQQTVRLLDDLGERYGSEHVYFNLRSPAEAIKLLCINHPALQKELTEAHQHGVGYTLVQAGTFLGYDDLQLPLGKNDLVLAPVIAGSGGSTGQILAGVGLIALSFIPIGAGIAAGVTASGGIFGGAAAFAGQAALSNAIFAIGTSLVLGGVSQMIAPQPIIPTLQNRTAPGQNTNASGPQGVSRATSGQQSYAFSGPANTVGVGATVPLVYGKLLIGSHLLSSRVQVADDSNPTGEFFGIVGEESVRINGEKPGYKFKALNGLRTRRWLIDQVRLENQTGNDAKKQSLNKAFPYSLEGKQAAGEVEALDAEGSKRRDNLQILMKVENGLFNIVGGQAVPAFVTYEMTITKNNYSGTSPTFANVRGTIQGLLNKTDTFHFAHSISYGVSGVEDSDTTVELNIRIIDTDAEESGGQLVVRGFGYNHFVDDSENNTEDLSEA